MAVVADGSGGFYIGGDFTRLGPYPRRNLAHILANGSVDRAFNPSPNGVVRALALSGQTLYVGGDFGAIAYRSRHRIAALDATTGHATSWNPNANGRVRALAVRGGTVYAGGQFRSIGGQPQSWLAALDATTGQAANWNAGPSGPVYALAVSGQTVYAGGNFHSIDGEPRNYIGALDGDTGNVTGWDPQIGTRNTPVYALAVSGDTVYAGGDFGSIGGQRRPGLAALDATTAKVTPGIRRRRGTFAPSPSPGRPSTSAGSSARSAAIRATTSPPSMPPPPTRRAGVRTPREFRQPGARLTRSRFPVPRSTPAATSTRSAASGATTSPLSIRRPGP